MINQLKEKLNSEYESFKKEMMTKSKEDIFENSYKISAYEEIKFLFMNVLTSTNMFSDETLDTLLHTDDLIGLVYLETLNNEVIFPTIDELSIFIGTYADTTI